MFKDIEAIIFDLDGTLMDSMWMWEDIDIEYFKRFDIPFTHKYQTDIEGMSFNEIAVYFKEVFKIPDSVEKMKADWNQMAWDKYNTEVFPKPGVLDFLEKLKQKNIRCAIATSNSIQLCMACLNAHNMAGYFSEIHTASEVKHGKPAPDIYLLVADKLGVDPKKCLVFEDLYKGICAAKNAGMRTCAVADEYSEEFIDKKIEAADYFIQDFTDSMITEF
ncbi:MAG: HAD family phosphatase [Lachnospiraceae bacterium]|nr:HAD family phosphatase [Lachnospiraceae bacterium]